MILIKLLPLRFFSRIFGLLARLYLLPGLRHLVLAGYSRIFRIQVQEAELPLGSYGTLHQFFIRKLKPGSRIVDDRETILCSPVDGKVLHAEPFQGNRLVQIKGLSYSLAELLGSEAEASNFANGTVFTIYLSPADYHRIHSPFSGFINQFHYIPGKLFPVNSFGVTNIPGLFAKNERIVTYLNVSYKRKEMTIAIIKVGALNVGNISLAYHDLHSNGWWPQTSKLQLLPQKVSIAKGDEMAIFHLGSTVQVILPEQMKGRSLVKPGEKVFMGQAIFTMD